jgi:hypothetical protein
MTLFPVHGSREMRAIKIRPVMAVVPVVVGAPIAEGTTSVTAKIGVVLLLGKMSKGQQMWICNQEEKRSLMQKLMSKKMTMKVRI